MAYYRPKHFDSSPEALAEARRRDLADSVTWPCAHYRPRHSAFVAKVRAVGGAA